MNGLKKSAKNKGSQWHAQSAHLAYTGYVKGKSQVTLREMWVMWTLLERPIYSHLAIVGRVMN